MNTQQRTARSAIEALRSGVPSRHAVTQLGTTQDEIKSKFNSSLDSLAAGQPVNPLVFSASFGRGKSHLLNFLKAQALDQHFVTSLVVVSPEMPLGNAHVVLKSLAESAESPNRTGRAARELSSSLNTNTVEYAELRRWSRDSGIDERFSAMLYLYEELRGNEEFRQRILNDFEGNPLIITDIRRELKLLGQTVGYNIKGKKNTLLARDRIRVLAQFYKACRCKGWVIMFDEVERIRVFSQKQRIAAWVEIGWWLKVAELAGAAILPIFTFTIGEFDDIIDKDEQSFRVMGHGSSNVEFDIFGKKGIELFKSATRIVPPSKEQDEQIMFRVKSIYEEAYEVHVQNSFGRKSAASTTIRAEIRAMITQWDLQRHYPEYIPNIHEEEIQHDDTEIPDTMLQDDENEA